MEPETHIFQSTRGSIMKNKTFLKGSALFALARKKAKNLSVESGDLKLEELILKIQDQEGHSACFRQKKTCPETACCWQVSCGAVMERNKS